MTPGTARFVWTYCLITCLCLVAGAGHAAECSTGSVRMDAVLGRLDGYKPPDRYPDVYREGFRIALKLSAAAGEATIDSVRLDHKFVPGRRTELAQPKDLDLIYGAGPATPLVFRVTVRGSSLERPRWIKKDGAVEAKSANFLDTGDRDFGPFNLRARETAELRGTVLAAGTGSYELIFRVGYAVRGARGECRTDPIRLYQDYDN